MDCRKAPSVIVSKGKAKTPYTHITIEDHCYDPTLITKPKTFHIHFISGTFHAPPISADPGKISSIHNS
jgi:hypothetical protein